MSRPLPVQLPAIGPRPFRLGTTSYIIPADMETNVRALAGRVDDIELLFFESDALGDEPDRAGIDRLGALARQHDGSFTVHLPIDIHLGHADPAARRHGIEACSRVMALTAPLSPLAYVLHLNGESGDFATAVARESWRGRAAGAVAAILSRSKVEPGRLCVENLDYPFDAVAPLVASLGVSICIDVGHLLMNGYGLDAHLAEYGRLARVLHLHGVLSRRDHVGLSHLGSERLTAIFSALRSDALSPEVVTLEVFHADALEDAYATVARYWP